VTGGVTDYSGEPVMTHATIGHRAASRARDRAKLGLPPGDAQHRRVLAVLTYLRA
jgi:hypothetical protein